MIIYIYMIEDYSNLKYIFKHVFEIICITYHEHYVLIGKQNKFIENDFTCIYLHFLYSCNIFIYNTLVLLSLLKK